MRRTGADARLRAELRERLPARCFDPVPVRALHGAFHLGVAAAAIALAGSRSWEWQLLAAAVAGHSLGALAFVAHELTHGSVVRGRTLTRLLEYAFWLPNGVPPTLWRRVHNGLHHGHAGTPRDPDRQPLRSERGVATRAYSKLFFPSDGALVRWNPLILAAFVPYLLRHSLAALMPRAWVPVLVPATPRYSGRDRCAIGLELVGVLAVQACIHWISGGGAAYLILGPGSLVVASSVVIGYVATNHYPQPLIAERDVLASTLSLNVPRWIDWLHGHMSLHVEHHLFPAMNPVHAPRVRALLEERAGERYRCASPVEAWRSLWDMPAFTPDPQPGTGAGTR